MKEVIVLLAEGSVYRRLAEAEIAVRGQAHLVQLLRQSAEMELIERFGKGDVKSLGPTLEDRERWFAVKMDELAQAGEEKWQQVGAALETLLDFEDELTRARMAVREYEAQLRMMSDT